MLILKAFIRTVSLRQVSFLFVLLVNLSVIAYLSSVITGLHAHVRHASLMRLHGQRGLYVDWRIMSAAGSRQMAITSDAASELRLPSVSYVELLIRLRAYCKACDESCVVVQYMQSMRLRTVISLLKIRIVQIHSIIVWKPERQTSLLNANELARVAARLKQQQSSKFKSSRRPIQLQPPHEGESRTITNSLFVAWTKG